MITKSAMITICGRPNVGKSTLTNALVGEKIAIVSNKPQTTRNRISAVVTRGNTQFVLMDTPGFHKPRTRLGDYMVNVVKESVADVDAVMLLVEPIANIGRQEEELIARLKETNVPAVLVINKIDTVEKAELLEVMSMYSQAHGFDAIIPISAKNNEGLDELMEQLDKYAVEGPQLFPDAGDLNKLVHRPEGAVLLPPGHDGLGPLLPDAGQALQVLRRGGVDVDDLPLQQALRLALLIVGSGGSRAYLRRGLAHGNGVGLGGALPGIEPAPGKQQKGRRQSQGRLFIPGYPSHFSLRPTLAV